ncbi:MAG: hypothetical protein V1889_02870 [archaeon]
MNWKTFRVYLFIILVALVVVVGVSFLLKISGFSLWNGVGILYCDNLCEMRMPLSFYAGGMG